MQVSLFHRTSYFPTSCSAITAVRLLRVELRLKFLFTRQVGSPLPYRRILAERLVSDTNATNGTLGLAVQPSSPLIIRSKQEAPIRRFQRASSTHGRDACQRSSICKTHTHRPKRVNYAIERKNIHVTKRGNHNNK